LTSGLPVFQPCPKPEVMARRGHEKDIDFQSYPLFIFYLFNREGILIARKGLNILPGGTSTILAASEGDNLYCVQQKKSGYKELVVYRMTWK